MLVARAETDSAVRNVIAVEMVTMIRVGMRPTFPSTQPKRRYMTTPSIVRIFGVKTPVSVPN